MTRAMLSLAVLLLALCAAGCGYRTGYTPPVGATVGVAFFENVSKERDLDRDFHVPLSESAQRIVRAPLVQPDRAEYLITGRILEFRRRNGIRDTDNRLLETGVRITVEARLERLAPGGTEREVLRRIEVQDERGYALSVSGGETEARARALRYIADRVVIDLFADLAWDAP
jgi:hypothetical protein